jgi:predicted dehydrogenase
MKPTPIKVALIGSGAISGTYLKNMMTKFSILEVVGCSDIIPERSAKRAEEFGIRQMTNEEILNDPEIKIIVNTTYPTAHYEVNKAALLAGKNVHCEKMIAVTLDEGKELLKIAKEKNLRIGMAPDTFLGGGFQTARKLIDDGMIGVPFMAQAMVIRGYQHDRGAGTGTSFVMQPGGGIPFDMGGYYMHALVHLLGPITRATGFAKCLGKTRIRKNPRNPLFGEEVSIDTINSMVGTLEFKSGVMGNIAIVSEGFGEIPRVEIYGSEGVISCPDPNTFGGPVRVRRKGQNDWGSDFMPMPLTHGFTEGCNRGIGVADMAWGIVNNRPHRAHGDMGFHVFEVIHGIWNGTETGKIHVMESTCNQPAPLASGYVESGLDEYALTL